MAIKRIDSSGRVYSTANLPGIIAVTSASVSGATGGNTGDVIISGDLTVSGRIVTSTGVFGATGNAAIEPVSDMLMDGGSF